MIHHRQKTKGNRSLGQGGPTEAPVLDHEQEHSRASDTQCAPATRRGVTLVELTITVLIMGIIAGVATPKISQSMNYFRAEAAAQRIVSDLTWARRHAKRIGKDQAVSFTVVSDTYDLTGMDDPNHPGQAYSVDLTSTGYAVTLSSADFDGNTGVTFNLFGQPRSGSPLVPLVPLIADGTVVINVGSQTRTILVDKDTGKASIQ